MAFAPVDEIVKGIKRSLGLDERLAAVFKAWETEAGTLAKGARIAGFKDGKLMIEADSNTHLQELTLRRRELIAKLNQHLGGERFVKGIRIMLAQGR